VTDDARFVRHDQSNKQEERTERYSIFFNDTDNSSELLPFVECAQDESTSKIYDRTKETLRMYGV
jgi:hypothetical protein